MSKLDEAIIFAVNAHKGQVRKVVKTPYILHPLEAVSIAGSITCDEDVLCGAVLHDVIEDTDINLDEIIERFGNRVAALVESETENKRKNISPDKTWKIRKEESIALLNRTNDLGTKTIWLADKLANLRSLSISYKRYGEDLWKFFNQKEKSMHKWYYKSIESALEKDFGDTVAFCEMKNLIKEIFN